MFHHHYWGNHMKKSLACCLSLLVLTGCATTSAEPAEFQPASSAPASPSPTATTTKAAPKTTKPAPTVSREEQLEQVYLESVRDEYPELQFSEDDSLVTIGQGLCDLYDGGAASSDVNDFILNAAGVEYTLNELITMHGAAVGAFCPEHIDKLG